MRRARVKGIIALMLSLGVIATASANDKETKYDGVAKPLVTSTIQYGTNDVYRGFIDYIARQGQILHGPVYDLDGNVVKKGDMLASLKKDYSRSLVEQAKGKLNISKSNLAFMKVEYERYKKLDKSAAVSKELYQNYVNNYFQALSQHNVDLESLQTAELELGLCEYRVMTDSIVDKVLMPFGLCAGELPIAVISQLDPMGIHIKMDREKTSLITPQSKVKIYPMNSDKPVGILPYQTLLTDDGITFRVRNYAVPADNIVDGKKVPVVHCFTIVDLETYGDHKNIGVPRDSIQKDSNGYFVWKAVNQKSNEPGKGIDKIFSVKKAYFTLGKLSKHILNYIYVDQIVPKNNDLGRDDLVVVNPPKDLKDGDSVCYYHERYQFMPGDKVNVEIEI